MAPKHDAHKIRTNRLLGLLLSVLVLLTVGAGFWLYRESVGWAAEHSVSRPTAISSSSSLGVMSNALLPAHQETAPSDNEATAPAQTNTQTAAPAQSTFSTSIQIVGDAACKSDTLEALQLLSDKAAAHYATVTKYVGIIECATQGSGMFAYEEPPRYLVGDATRNAGTIWYAGTIAHDAGHSKLYHDYKDAHPGEGVPSDIWTGEAAERACLEAQHDALSKIGAAQSTLDYVQNAISTDYFNVPYDERWW